MNNKNFLGDLIKMLGSVFYSNGKTEIKFHKVSPEYKQGEEDGTIPVRATRGSAGYDFISTVDALIYPNQDVLIWTNVKAEMPEDVVLKIYPRSGLATKQGIILKNLVGVVDSDYFSNIDNDGNIGICLYKIGGETPYEIKKGDKIAQGVFEKFLTTKEDSSLSTRISGFGSTGKAV